MQRAGDCQGRAAGRGQANSGHTQAVGICSLKEQAEKKAFLFALHLLGSRPAAHQIAPPNALQCHVMGHQAPQRH